MNKKSGGEVPRIEPLKTPSFFSIKKRKVKELNLLSLIELNANPTENIGAGKAGLDLKPKKIMKKREARRNPQEDLTKVSEEGQIQDRIRV